MDPTQPMSRSRWRSLARVTAACLAVLVGLSAGAAVLVRREPTFYRQQKSAADATDASETLSRRAITKASSWHAAFSRPGAWDAVATADEINAWLAVDLPRNHPHWLPAGISHPRLEFRPGTMSIGVRVGRGPLSAVAWCDLAIRLRDANQLSIVMERAGLGAVPLPRPPLLRELARRIDRFGMVTDLLVLDGRMTLMVYIPSTHDAGATSHWLNSLAIGAGELLVAGETRSAAVVRPGLPASGEPR